jgi:signal transduction histidine kinase
LGGNEIRHLYEDSRNRLWISCQERGLYILDNGRLEDWGRRHNFVNFPARCVYEDAAGVFWIGTLRNGLYRDRDHELFHYPLTNTNPDENVHGVPDQTVHEILEDDHGNLWLSQDPAVPVLSKADLERVARGDTKHLPYRDVARETPVRFGGCNGGSQPAALRAADGRFWFAARGGALMMDAIGWKTNTLAPHVLIERVMVDHQACFPRDRADFPPGNGEVEIHFTALTFTEPGKVRFQYQLQGVDQVWVKAGAHRSARYAKLRPGNYTFLVQAEYGGRTSNVARLDFHLAPRFYETGWFVTACFLALAGSVWFVHRLRLRVQSEMMGLEQQNALARERSRIAQDLHDDLGANLTEISFLSTLLARQPEKESGAAHLNRIHRTARHLLQALDEIVWATNPKNDTLDSFLGYVGHFAQEFLGAAGIACRLDLPAQPPEIRLSAEQRHNLFLATKEALNNAAKYSGATEIWIRLSLEPGEIKLSVEDNGQGFVPEAVQGDGNGLLNMSQRLAAVGGRLEINSVPRQGTSVRLRIPLPPDHS